MSLQGKRYEFGYAKCYDCPIGTNYDARKRATMIALRASYDQAKRI
jgi:hypothetical protein